MILSARLIQRPRVQRECAECGRPIYVSPLRVAFREQWADEPPTVVACYFHPYYQEDEEQRACAPDHPTVRAALEPKRRRSEVAS